mmetsp:Transcript_25699/g.64790  ORF Transcript_25699/g.64790 Transcript_25699/m.64790 type:complete len:307 (+) Transcript_25699:217-1137(+)
MVEEAEERCLSLSERLGVCMRERDEALRGKEVAEDGSAEHLEDVEREKRVLEGQKQVLEGEKQVLKGTVGDLQGERDALSMERDTLCFERDALAVERDAVIRERDVLRTQNHRAKIEMGTLSEANNQRILANERDVVSANEGDIVSAATAQRSTLVAEMCSPGQEQGANADEGSVSETRTRTLNARIANIEASTEEGRGREMLLLAQDLEVLQKREEGMQMSMTLLKRQIGRLQPFPHPPPNVVDLPAGQEVFQTHSDPTHLASPPSGGEVCENVVNGSNGVQLGSREVSPIELGTPPPPWESPWK